jgi:hypothetical protein
MFFAFRMYARRRSVGRRVPMTARVADPARLPSGFKMKRPEPTARRRFLFVGVRPSLPARRQRAEIRLKGDEPVVEESVFLDFHSSIEIAQRMRRQ